MDLRRRLYFCIFFALDEKQIFGGRGFSCSTLAYAGSFPSLVQERGGAVNYKRMCVEKAINLACLVLSWLHLNRPKTAPASLWLGRPLTSKQWGVVKRFERLFAGVASSGDFGPSAMGRSAAKVESLVAILHGLEETAKQLPSF